MLKHNGLSSGCSRNFGSDLLLNANNKLQTLSQQGQGLLGPWLQGQTADLFQGFKVFKALDKRSHQDPKRQPHRAQVSRMLGAFLLGFFEEEVERKRHRGYERGQVGEDEGQGLNREAYDSCMEGEDRREEEDRGFIRKQIP